MKTKSAVLLMAYGTPRSLDEVEEYYMDIRRGRRPTPELLEELKSRYMAIGGKTPLLEITREQAKKLARATGLKTYVGMKHWSPFIKETVAHMKADGCTRVTALVLAPHFSAMSTFVKPEALMDLRLSPMLGPSHGSFVRPALWNEKHQ